MKTPDVFPDDSSQVPKICLTDTPRIPKRILGESPEETGRNAEAPIGPTRVSTFGPAHKTKFNKK